MNLAIIEKRARRDDILKDRVRLYRVGGPGPGAKNSDPYACRTGDDALSPAHTKSIVVR